MEVGDLVRTNARYGESIGCPRDVGLLGIVTDTDNGYSDLPVEVKMLHDGKIWVFEPAELDVAGEEETSDA